MVYSGFDPKNGAIQREALLGLLGAQAICILPLLFVLPPWVAAVWVFALGYRLQIFRGRCPFPSVMLKTIVGGMCVAGVVLTYSTIAGVEPMVAFLVCSFVLKLLEVKYKKDAYVILFICFIAIGAQFLFSQHILSTLYGVFSMVMILAAWQAIFFARDVPMHQHLIRSVSLVGQSVPFMLVLFIVMPRLGPLWSVPMPEGKGRTGFSDTMAPGDIGNLVKSGETAFRVTFIDKVPPIKSMYWRGLVLDYFDGRTWRASQTGMYSSQLRQQPILKPSDETLHYSVILEPHNQRWLFTLGDPLQAESPSVDIQLLENKVLQSKSDIINKTQYSVVSKLDIDADTNDLSMVARALNLQLPNDFNPRAEELAATWRRWHSRPRGIINEALAFYAKSFKYTLRPPVLGKHSVDDFLFDSQSGFCEHFSSSFVFLMRAAGIPARVVIGYQGGTNYGTQDYFTVKQSDAHAWAEVWLSGQGWVAVDPTASVAPTRIDMGVEMALGEEDRELIAGGMWESSWMFDAYRAWDAVGYNWNRWVLNYDSKMQESFLRFILGAYEPLRVALAFIAVCAFIFCGYFAVILLKRPAVAQSTESKYARKVIKKLHNMGFDKPAHFTFAHLSEQLKEKDPSIAAALLSLHHSYEKLRFGNKEEELDAFVQRCRRFPHQP